jgi:hypothetical protein
MSILLKFGADPSAPDYRGIPPLHIACGMGRAETASLLLEALGSGIHTVEGADLEGNTALMAAAKGGHRDVVRLLLNCGAHVLMQNTRGMTAVHFAKLGNHMEVVAVLESFSRLRRETPRKSLPPAAAKAKAFQNKSVLPGSPPMATSSSDSSGLIVVAAGMTSSSSSSSNSPHKSSGTAQMKQEDHPPKDAPLATKKRPENKKKTRRRQQRLQQAEEVRVQVPGNDAALAAGAKDTAAKMIHIHNGGRHARHGTHMPSISLSSSSSSSPLPSLASPVTLSRTTAGAGVSPYRLPRSLRNVVLSPITSFAATGFQGPSSLASSSVSPSVLASSSSPSPMAPRHSLLRRSHEGTGVDAVGGSRPFDDMIPLSLPLPRGVVISPISVSSWPPASSPLNHVVRVHRTIHLSGIGDRPLFGPAHGIGPSSLLSLPSGTTSSSSSSSSLLSSPSSSTSAAHSSHTSSLEQHTRRSNEGGGRTMRSLMATLGLEGGGMYGDVNPERGGMK